jgi:hypothetical protein
MEHGTTAILASFVGVPWGGPAAAALAQANMVLRRIFKSEHTSELKLAVEFHWRQFVLFVFVLKQNEGKQTSSVDSFWNLTGALEGCHVCSATSNAKARTIFHENYPVATRVKHFQKRTLSSSRDALPRVVMFGEWIRILSPNRLTLEHHDVSPHGIMWKFPIHQTDSTMSTRKYFEPNKWSMWV